MLRTLTGVFREMRVFSGSFRVVLFVVFLFLSACTEMRISGRAPVRESDDNLTLEFASARREQIKSVSYDLRFSMRKGSEEYEGKAVLAVELARLDRPLSIDFIGKKLHSVKVGGQTVKDLVERKGSFDIPVASLSSSMRIEVEYTNEFSTEGDGVMRSVDPEDGAEYIATDFEPYRAHSLFPCFDQPDLRAVYNVEVEAPKDWRVISNEVIKDTSAVGKDRVVTRFAPTQPFSTYLFFLGAGPFFEWTDKEEKLPLHIWARKSIAKHVDQENLFRTVKLGLRFFSVYFDTPYPFGKFGMVFIPEFASTGMENPGAIALTEEKIFRGPATAGEREERDDLILHEMAHIWFGDLVTMKWWNDLWLNESFATYLASTAASRVLRAYGTWAAFYASKTWGYWQDQLVTTHPIETATPDVRTTKGNFDGITYAKGAAALKQLHFLVGEDGFRDGLRNYFKKYAFKNTTREDFIAEIAATSKVDLKKWTQAWLQTAGLNRVRAKWSCKDGKLDRFVIEQKPTSSNALLPHRTRFRLMRAGADGLGLADYHTFDVDCSEAETVVGGLKDKVCPDFVLPNVYDLDYALFALDPESLKLSVRALKGGLSLPVHRLLVWGSLYQMVRDGELAPTEYMEIALSALEVEEAEAVLAIQLGEQSPILNVYSRYLNPKARAELAPRFERLLLKRASEAAKNSSMKLVFFDVFVRTARTKESLEILRALLKPKPDAVAAKKIALTLDQDRRWKVMKTLARNGVDGAEAQIAEEAKRDATTEGLRNAYVAKAAIPRADVKQKYWDEIVTSKEIAFSNLSEAAREVHNNDRPELSEPLVAKFFATALEIDWKSKENLVWVYFDNLFPGHLCTKALLDESAMKLKGAKNLTSTARRAWLESNDELERCVRVRK